MTDTIEFCLNGKKLIIDLSRPRIDLRLLLNPRSKEDLDILRELAEFSKTVKASSLPTLAKMALAEWVKLRRGDSLRNAQLEKLVSEIEKLRLQIQDLEKMLGKLVTTVL